MKNTERKFNKKILAGIMVVMLGITSLLPVNSFFPYVAYAWTGDTTYTGEELNSILKELVQGIHYHEPSVVLDERPVKMVTAELEDSMPDPTVENGEEGFVDTVEFISVAEEAAPEEFDVPEYIPDPVPEDVVIEEIPDVQEEPVEFIDYDAVYNLQNLIHMLPSFYDSLSAQEAESSFYQIDQLYAQLTETEKAMVDMTGYAVSKQAYEEYQNSLAVPEVEEESLNPETGMQELTEDEAAIQEAENPVLPSETENNDEESREEKRPDYNTQDYDIQAMVWSKTAPSSDKKAVSLSYNGKLVAWYETAEDQKNKDQASDNDWFLVFDDYGNQVKVYKEYKNTVFFYYFAEDPADYPYFNQNMAHAFQNMRSLTDISGLKYFRSDYVTNMSFLFADDVSLYDISPLSGFSVYSLQDVSYIFSGCTSLREARTVLSSQMYDLKANEVQAESAKYMAMVQKYANLTETPFDTTQSYQSLSDYEKAYYPEPYRAWDTAYLYAEGAFNGTNAQDYPNWFYSYMGWEKPKNYFHVSLETDDSGELLLVDKNGTPVDGDSCQEGDIVYLKASASEGFAVSNIEITSEQGIISWDALTEDILYFSMPQSDVVVAASFVAGGESKETEENASSEIHVLNEDSSSYEIHISEEGQGHAFIVDENGSEISLMQGKAGEPVTLSVIPAEGNSISYVDIYKEYGEWIDYEVLSNTSVQFIMPEEEVYIVAAFEPVEETEDNLNEEEPEEDEEETDSEEEPSEKEEEEIPEEDIVLDDEFTDEYEAMEEEPEYTDMTMEVQPEDLYFLSEDYNYTQFSNINFSSQRILVSTGNAEIFVDPSVILSSYQDLYLLQFDSEEVTLKAYAYYKEHADYVEADSGISIAEGTAAEEVILTSQMSEEENPLVQLQQAMEEAGSSNHAPQYDIALIDTGALGAVHSVSMLGNDTNDQNGHGTAMLQYIQEVNPFASVLSIKAFNSDGLATASEVYAAIQYAISQNVRIINLSVSALASPDNAILRQAVAEAVAKGILVVGAAGNNGRNAGHYMPGGLEEALIIGAADHTGKRIAASNYGTTVDYNVVADSTSEAAAKFSGWLSGNSLESIGSVVNKGFIFQTDYLYQGVTVPDFSTMAKQEIIDFVHSLTKEEVQFLFGELSPKDGEDIKRAFGCYDEFNTQEMYDALMAELNALFGVENFDLVFGEQYISVQSSGTARVVGGGGLTYATPWGMTSWATCFGDTAVQGSGIYAVETNLGNFRAYCIEATSLYPVGSSNTITLRSNDALTMIYLVSPLGPLYGKYDFSTRLSGLDGSFYDGDSNRTTYPRHACDRTYSHCMMSYLYSGDWGPWNSAHIASLQAAISDIRNLFQTDNECKAWLNASKSYVVHNGSNGTTDVQDVFWIEIPEKPVSLIVQKTVGAEDGSIVLSKNGDSTIGADEEFTFTLNVLKENGKQASGTYSYTGSKTGTIKAKKGTVKLKKGQTITISGIPAGYTYTITEKEIDGVDTTVRHNGGSASSSNSVSGTIPKAPDNASFTFTFSASSGGTYNYVRGDSSGNYESTIRTINSGGTFNLKQGERVKIVGIKYNDRVTVTETANSNYTTSLKAAGDAYSAGRQFAARIKENKALVFKNIYKTPNQTDAFSNKRTLGTVTLSKTTNNNTTGEVVVRKVVNGNGADAYSNTSFTFSLNVKNGSGTVQNTNYSYEGDKTGTVRGNGGTFTLKAGERIKITGIPVGYSYTITETENTAFNQYVKMNSGSKAKGRVATGKIPTAPSGSQSFTFTVTFGDGGTYPYRGSKSGSMQSGKTITLAGGQSVTFYDIPVGTKYTIKESKATVANGSYAASGVPASGKVKSSGTTVSATNTFSPTAQTAVFENQVKQAKAYVLKKSANTAITNGDNHYSLDGAEFGVYNSQADANSGRNPLFVLTTGATHITGQTETVEITPGKTYYVKEVKASPGYKVSSSVVSFTANPGETKKIEINEEPYPKTKVEVYKTDNITGKPLTGAQFTLYEYSISGGRKYVSRGTLTEGIDSTGTSRTGYYSYYGTVPGTTTKTRFIYASDDNPDGKFVIDETRTPTRYTSMGYVTSVATGNSVAWSSGEQRVSSGAASRYNLHYDVANIQTEIKIRLFKYCPTTPDVILSDCTIVVYQYNSNTGTFDTAHPITMTWEDDATSEYGGYYKATLEITPTNMGRFKWEETVAQAGYALANPSSEEFNISLTKENMDYFVVKNPLIDQEVSYQGTVRIQKQKAGSVESSTTPRNTDAKFSVYEWDPQAQDYKTTPIQTLVYRNGYYETTSNLLAYRNPESWKYNEGKFKVVEEASPSGLLLGSGWEKEFQITTTNASQAQVFTGSEFTIPNPVNSYQIEKHVTGSTVTLSGVTFKFTKGTQTQSISTGTTTTLQQSALGFSYRIQNNVIYLEEIEPGTYSYKETSTPALYKLDPQTYSFTVGRDGRITENGVTNTSFSKDIYNTISAKMAITKTEPAATRQTEPISQAATGFPSGTEFEVKEWDSTNNTWKNTVYQRIVYDGSAFVDASTGELAQLDLTDDNEGRFLISETKATPGYIQDDSEYEIRLLPQANGTLRYRILKESVQISESTYTSTVNLSFENKPNKFSVLKTDEAGDPLGGATFLLEKIGSSESYEMVTDVEGRSTVYRLSPGNYRIRETDPPTGYTGDPHVYKFTVKEDGTLEVDASMDNASGDEMEMEFTMKNRQSLSLRISKTDFVTGQNFEMFTGFPAGTEFELYEWNGSEYVFKTTIVYKPN